MEQISSHIVGVSTCDKFPIQETERFNVQEHISTSSACYPNYENVIDRINSFVNWPTNCNISPSEFAFCGLFYTGKFGMVRCFQCGIGLKDWGVDDNPLNDHYKYANDCLFINKMFGPRPIEIDTFPGAKLHKEYRTLKLRMASFTHWQKSSQLALKLAKTGLFYTGVGDLCRCFVCDGVLLNWNDIDDDPWFEHARYIPTCSLVLHAKGKSFVDVVQDIVMQELTKIS
jgi:hypothetical protein